MKATRREVRVNTETKLSNENSLKNASRKEGARAELANFLKSQKLSKFEFVFSGPY